MQLSEQINEIAKALNAFRQAVKQPPKDANNPFFKSKYVQLEGVVDAIDKALPNTGLSYTQDVTSEGSQVNVTTLIFHTSGQYIILGPLAVPVTKNDAQAFGSAETYARRYSLSAAFGITSDVDDDGNAAVNSFPKQAPRRQTRPSTGLNVAMVNTLKKLMTQQFNAMPATNKNGDPKPQSLQELEDTWIGFANGHFKIKANSLETLTPEAASGIKTLLEGELKKLAGGEHE